MSRYHLSAPFGTEVVFGRVEYGDEDADDAFSAGERGGRRGLVVRGGEARAGEEGAREVADGGYDCGEVVAAIPEAVVGCLVAENLWRVLGRVGDVGEVGKVRA